MPLELMEATPDCRCALHHERHYHVRLTRRNDDRLWDALTQQLEAAGELYLRDHGLTSDAARKLAKEFHMPRDRVVRFDEESQPRARADLKHLVEDYFGAVAASVEWQEDRFYVTLVGRPSCPARRIDWAPHLVRRPYDDEVRSIEVWMGDDSIYVMTRMQDDLTSCLADGLVSLIARAWRGTLET